MTPVTSPVSHREPGGPMRAGTVRPLRPHEAVRAMKVDGRAAERLRVGTQNIRMMHLLERIAGQFAESGVPLMALKGAALNLTLYRRPDERPMSDLDLLVRPEHAERSMAALASAGCRRGSPLLREDFFPRFHYEAEFVSGHTHPARVDLHVRPFRPLRYSRLVPAHALWDRAVQASLGTTPILVPCPEDMLIHLSAHAAIHADWRGVWLNDIARWVAHHGSRMNWRLFADTVSEWGLVLPVRQAIARVEEEFGRLFPREIRRQFRAARVSWCDRLALCQAPHDVDHPARHVIVDALCTSGWRFRLAYLGAVLMPGRKHMEEWYRGRHWGWLPFAHGLRWMRPLGRSAFGWPKQGE